MGTDKMAKEILKGIHKAVKAALVKNKATKKTKKVKK
jgi:hypothetical protein